MYTYVSDLWHNRERYLRRNFRLIVIIITSNILVKYATNYKFKNSRIWRTWINPQREISMLVHNYVLLLLLIILHWLYNVSPRLSFSIVFCSASFRDWFQPAWFSGYFWTVNCSWVLWLTPRPTPNLEIQGVHFVYPLLFDVSDMDGPTRSLRSHQHNSPGHWGALIRR
jgi:hypothetical protein